MGRRRAAELQGGVLDGFRYIIWKRGEERVVSVSESERAELMGGGRRLGRRWLDISVMLIDKS